MKKGAYYNLENYGCISAAERRFGFGFRASTQGCILTPIVIPRKIPNMNAIIEYIKNSGPTRYILIPQAKQVLSDQIK